MRHYEVVFLVHPSQSEQVPGMIERYQGNLEKRGGIVRRAEVPCGCPTGVESRDQLNRFDRR